MIDPAGVCLFIGPGLRKFKRKLFERIGAHIQKLGGSVIDGDFAAVERLPRDIIPIVGCSPEFAETVPRWQREGRRFIYWDRGYARRVFATWLPRGDEIGLPGGYYRWHCNSYQMQRLRDVPDDRWRALQIELKPWRHGGRHIVVAEPSPTYQAHHRIEGWTARTVAVLKQLTPRPLVLRDKESRIPLGEDCAGAHALITHGSIAAVEAAIMGCPVFVDASSAAALVGLTDLARIEHPIYPERAAWCRSLAYCQFTEAELVDGTLWRLIE
jgi:hypothetical protein